MPNDPVPWLLEGDPSVRRQVLQDLLHEPAETVAVEHVRVTRSGPGADLLGQQREDGQWGVGVYDGDDWLSTTDALWILRELGADPRDAAVRSAVDLVATRVRWEERNGGRPFFDGETEACVNGRVLALGATFGRPSEPLLARLLGEQLDDGGWNCEAPSSVRSSFHSTICVLEGLQGFGGRPAVDQALHRGTEYLLDRGLLRSRSTGQLLDESWLTGHAPAYWCYDLLRGMELLRLTHRLDDPRATEPLDALRRARRADGTWPAAVHPGRALVAIDTERLVTLRALRVLDAAGAG